MASETLYVDSGATKGRRKSPRRGKRVNSRRKGASAELELVHVLRALGFTGARRGQQFRGTADSPDVVDAIPGAAIESKRRKSAVDGWWEKAAAEAGPELVPIVMHRRDRGVWKLTIALGDIWRLYRLLAAARARGCDVETT
jgi:hypothetical protein